jgi:hypothetical protein
MLPRPEASDAALDVALGTPDREARRPQPEEQPREYERQPEERGLGDYLGDYVKLTGRALMPHMMFTNTAKNMVTGFAKDMWHAGEVIGDEMGQNTSRYMRGDETIMDNGDVYRDGKFVGNTQMDQNELIRASREVADLIPMSAVGYGLAGVKSDPNTLYSLGGINSRTANREALKQAQDMMAAGADPTSITKQTGWWYDPKLRNWFYEIDDSGAKLTPWAEDAIRARTPITDVPTDQLLDHPALFDAHPEMRQAKTSLHPQKGITPRGSFDPRTSDVWVEGNNSGSVLSTLLHERGGHDAMLRNGTEAGANRSMFKGTLARRARAWRVPTAT